jgi:hypothetical protein
MFARTLITCALALSATATVAQNTSTAPQRFVIEREIAGASKMSPDQLREAAKTSNRVLREMGPDIQWVQSFVAGDKIYCVYTAPNEAMIRSHAEKAGFPANRITPVAAVIDPTTAQAGR